MSKKPTIEANIVETVDLVGCWRSRSLNCQSLSRCPPTKLAKMPDELYGVIKKVSIFFNQWNPKRLVHRGNYG